MGLLTNQLFGGLNKLLQELINDGDSFVLDAPDKVYVLDGPNASPFEKRQANETAENIERARSGACMGHV